MADKTKNTHRALMTLKPTARRGEIKRGQEFAARSVQEGLDLVGLSQAVALAADPKEAAPKEAAPKEAALPAKA
jgi:hypothetical protein